MPQKSGIMQGIGKRLEVEYMRDDYGSSTLPILQSFISIGAPSYLSGTLWIPITILVPQSL